MSVLVALVVFEHCQQAPQLMHFVLWCNTVACGGYVKMVLLYIYRCCLLPQVLSLYLQVE